ncbi:MAG: tripartite tricarboxylate transporter substrate binding protein [Betaproteobacteria bacterium]|nr:tripartite tricarboxylate transporter substrate binding protein [Betaproteobacteria bacterium]
MRRAWKVFFGLVLATATLQLNAQPLSDSNYPRRPVTIIVPFASGGQVDAQARTLAPKMSGLLGQQVVILNREGAGGVIGTELVARATPDGYTLLWGSSGPLAISPHLNAKLPFDPLRDFAPISLFAVHPFILALHPSVPASSLKALIKLAQAHPGKLNYASTGTGSAPYFAAEMFNNMAAINIIHVPYKSVAQLTIDLIGGQVDLYFASGISSRGHFSSGKLRGIAVTSTRRTDLLPELPTMAEAGLPGYESVGFSGLLAPAGTPAGIMAQLGDAVSKSLEDRDIRERITSEGGFPAGGTPAQFSTFIKSELVKYGKLAKQAQLVR